MKAIKAINTILIVTALFLAINLVQPVDRIAGKLAYSLDYSEPLCYFNNDGIQSEIPIERCCYEIQKQISCEPNGLGFKCYTSASSGRHYSVNSKAMGFCREEGFDVEKG